jgi:hypothetical protein
MFMGKGQKWFKVLKGLYFEITDMQSLRIDQLLIF